MPTSEAKIVIELGAAEIGDQGAQFTSRDFTSVLEANQLAISMDGHGRALDNVFMERLWWSVKWEDIYLKAYGTVADLHEGLERYFDFYDHRRKHQSLDDRTPYEIFQASLTSEAQRRDRRPKYPLGDTILNSVVPSSHQSSSST